MRKNEKKAGSVTCRTNAGYAVAGIFLMYGAAFGLLAITDEKHPAPPLEICLSIAGVVLPGIVLSICWERVCHITADVEGITWRFFLRERRARWDEVTDCFQAAANQNQTQGLVIVKTKSGSICVSRRWKNHEALLEAVQRSAINAKWTKLEIVGTRSDDPWPRVFHYAPVLRKRQAWAAGILGAVFLPAITVLLWQNIQQEFGILGTSRVIGMFCLAIVLVYPLGIGLLLMSRHTLRLLRRYGEDTLEVTTEGITLTSGSRVLSALWADVGDYHIATTQTGAEYVLSLRGPEETRITWSGCISESWLLARIVEKYAPHPVSAQGAEPGWRYDSSDTAARHGLIPSQARFTAQGGTFFGYQNLAAQMPLFVATSIVAVVALMPFLMRFFDLGKTVDWSFILGVCVPFVTVLLYGWWRYFVGGIEIDDFWITQRTLFGQRRIAWISITDYKSVGDPYIVRGQKGAPIAFWASISRFEELKAEIERRAPTPQTGWKKLPAEKR